jgi:hypothetical protein
MMPPETSDQFCESLRSLMASPRDDIPRSAIALLHLLVHDVHDGLSLICVTEHRSDSTKRYARELGSTDATAMRTIAVTTLDDHERICNDVLDGHRAHTPELGRAAERTR